MTHHGAALRKLTRNSRLVLALTDNWRRADLDPADRALCGYAEQLTIRPSAVTDDEVDLLRQEDFDDRAIHDATQVVAYFNSVVWIADGLGIEREAYWSPEERL